MRWIKFRPELCIKASFYNPGLCLNHHVCLDILLYAASVKLFLLGRRGRGGTSIKNMQTILAISGALICLFFAVVWALGKIKEAPIGVFRLLKMPPFLPNMEPKSNSFLEISCY